MSNNIFRQEPDRFTDNPRCTPDVEAAIERNQAQLFIDDTPDYVPTQGNWVSIKNLLKQQNLPVTRRNLGLAYEFLKTYKVLETGDDGPELTYKKVPLTKSEAGITKVYAEPVKRYDTEGIAENPLLREKPERRNELASKVLNKRVEEDSANRALSPIGQPVTQELKTKFRESLKSNHRVTTMSTGNARAAVAELFPDMGTRSIQFSRLVADLMKDN